MCPTRDWLNSLAPPTWPPYGQLHGWEALELHSHLGSLVDPHPRPHHLGSLLLAVEVLRHPPRLLSLCSLLLALEALRLHPRPRRPDSLVLRLVPHKVRQVASSLVVEVDPRPHLASQGDKLAASRQARVHTCLACYSTRPTTSTLAGTPTPRPGLPPPRL